MLSRDQKQELNYQTLSLQTKKLLWALDEEQNQSFTFHLPEQIDVFNGKHKPGYHE